MSQNGLAAARRGPLSGIRVVELAGIGPAPFCGMLLADLGADVVRVDRPGGRQAGNPLSPELDLLNRSRRSIALNLKTPSGVAALLRLVAGADALIEGFRPGVAERLGFGPEVCTRRNPRLVYGRMTGWGQDGPNAARAGHDINYIALTGALDAIGPPGLPPVAPLNLLGDFGGGGMLLALGLVAALLEARISGRGQVVDAAIVDGTALLTTMIHAMRAQGIWSDDRGSNLLDGGAHFYGVYECACGGYLSVGAIEPQFYRRLLDGLGLAGDPEFQAGHTDPARWPTLRARLRELFRTRTRDEWCALLAADDTCVAPVLPMAEAPQHPHNRQRGTFTELGGIVQPSPAPRFSRSGETAPNRPPLPGQHTGEVLAEAGFTEEEIEMLGGAAAR
ncbi:CaiB/BaiF CoA transferase family protein [Prauserella muralis]|uniref:Carnitine dehydratase n=1 Tax=Prauserella muralis TaxID=588067 RepID=A0A2V4B0S3_9PSEU|nr:CaiB/BaiF CoA-transferase family protein [Prauserella muralis]PXY27861.1 carnitine dehydratase [Prauserella muralis]TWE22370.1 alpha-methylacyl-CoA racemase [Prauserella muralis]